MRILIVIDDYFNKSNGLCISTQRFVKEFRKRGHEVRIASCAIGGQPDYPLPEMIIPFFKGIIEKEGFHMAKPKKSILTKAVKWADVVAIETPFPVSWQSAKIAKKMNKPVYGTFHIYPGNITESLHINNRFFDAMFMYFARDVSFKNCDAIQCPSDKVKKQLLKYHFKQKLYTISNGIPESFINQEHKYRIDNPFTIVNIGRYSREKHQEVLLEAMQYVKYKDKIVTILAGKGPLKEQFKKLGQKLPNPPIMKFYSHKELQEIMDRADLVVHCADVEIEGMSCMEAFAAGCVPVIADSPLSSTVEYALTAENKFPAGDYQALAQRITYWYEHPEELKKMRERYRIYAKAHTVSDSANLVLKMINTLLQEHKGNS